MNPAEFLLDLVNTDFAYDGDSAQKELANLKSAWNETSLKQSEMSRDTPTVRTPSLPLSSRQNGPSPLLLPITLVHRSLIKAYRDILVYGIRIAM